MQRWWVTVVTICILLVGCSTPVIERPAAVAAPAIPGSAPASSPVATGTSAAAGTAASRETATAPGRSLPSLADTTPNTATIPPQADAFNPAAVVAAAERVAPGEENWSTHLVNLYHPLPENYAPPLLSTVASDCTYNTEVTYLYDDRALPRLEDMIRAANADGMQLYVSSTWRTSEFQKLLHANEVASYRQMGYSEAEAVRMGSRYVAWPDTSEHQLGLAVDMVTASHYWLSETFDSTPAFAWLQENAAEYGFILRYAPDKVIYTGITYEPWHYRYVGQEHAIIMQQHNLCLEEYHALYLQDDTGR